ncbi:uncharacterized protein LOC108143806 [Drosophila elegans]|uniref:uncharacterized protein LOC108143806 n=1 Tax=Drosophila elegans TaxID=30023 RepID=UPI0007E813E9|nr:uncharacterized protein LOC108143806 [Drosophila elegans]
MGNRFTSMFGNRNANDSNQLYLEVHNGRIICRRVTIIDHHSDLVHRQYENLYLSGNTYLRGRVRGLRNGPRRGVNGTYARSLGRSHVRNGIQRSNPCRAAVLAPAPVLRMQDGIEFGLDSNEQGGNSSNGRRNQQAGNSSNGRRNQQERNLSNMLYRARREDLQEVYIEVLSASDEEFEDAQAPS